MANNPIVSSIKRWTVNLRVEFFRSDAAKYQVDSDYGGFRYECRK